MTYAVSECDTEMSLTVSNFFEGWCVLLESRLSAPHYQLNTGVNVRAQWSCGGLNIQGYSINPLLYRRRLRT